MSSTSHISRAHARAGRPSLSLSPYIEDRQWGRLERPDPMSVARTGIARYRLSVYAPGTSDHERGELVAARRWWLGSTVITLVAEFVVLSSGAGYQSAAVVALGGLAASWYWLARTRRIRRNTRTLRVAVVVAGEPREVIGDATLFAECCRRLAIVDNGGANATVISPVDRETIWAEVYERLKRAHPMLHSN